MYFLEKNKNKKQTPALNSQPQTEVLQGCESFGQIWENWNNNH